MKKTIAFLLVLFLIGMPATAQHFWSVGQMKIMIDAGTSFNGVITGYIAGVAEVYDAEGIISLPTNITPGDIYKVFEKYINKMIEEKPWNSTFPALLAARMALREAYPVIVK